METAGQGCKRDAQLIRVVYSEMTQAQIYFIEERFAQVQACFPEASQREASAGS
jgi:hypothetical protein